MLICCIFNYIRILDLGVINEKRIYLFSFLSVLGKIVFYLLVLEEIDIDYNSKNIYYL